MKKKVKKDFYDLKNKNILFFSKVELKNHITKIWNNVDDWWSQEEILKIRTAFRDKYSEPDITSFNFEKKMFK